MNDGFYNGFRCWVRCGNGNGALDNSGPVQSSGPIIQYGGSKSEFEDTTDLTSTKDLEVKNGWFTFLGNLYKILEISYVSNIKRESRGSDYSYSYIKIIVAGNMIKIESKSEEELSCFKRKIVDVLINNNGG